MAKVAVPSFADAASAVHRGAGLVRLRVQAGVGRDLIRDEVVRKERQLGDDANRGSLTYALDAAQRLEPLREAIVARE